MKVWMSFDMVVQFLVNLFYMDRLGIYVVNLLCNRCVDVDCGFRSLCLTIM